MEACGRRGLRLREKRSGIRERKEEREADNYGKYERLLSFPGELHFTSFSAILLPNPLVLSLSPCPFISPPWPSSSDPLSVWLFLPPYVALYSASLFHLLSSPQTHAALHFLSSLLFLFYLLLHSPLFLFLFSFPFLSLGSINSSCERKCLTVDSLTHIKADTL